MSFYETINEAMKNPELRILGQISITEEEYKDLLHYTRQKTLHIQPFTIAPSDIFLSVALVQIAIRKYSEGNYWDYFKNEIDLDVPSSRTNQIGQIFIATLTKYHLFQIEREEGTKYAYVENIKAHTFVPTNYLQRYLDFLFAFYDKNLLRQLPSNIDEDFSEMSEFFAGTLKETSDRFILRNLDNKPAKSYKLLKATRALFAQGDQMVLSELLYSHLKVIDNYYYDGVIPTSDDRFILAFTNWLKGSSKQIEKEKGEHRGRGDVFYRKPYFYMDRSTGIAYLVIPEQKIRNEDFESEAFVFIDSGDTHLKIRLSLYRAFGVVVSEAIKIEIKEPFEEFRITISSKNDRSFSVPKKIYRIFDEDFYELPKLRNGHNYLLVKKGVEVRGEKPTYKNDNHPEWNEYSFDGITENSVIYIDNEPISTNGIFHIGPNYDHVSHEYELYDEKENRIQTSYKHPTISFKVSKQALEGCFLYVREQRIHVKTNAASVVELPGETMSFGITMILEDVLPESDGVYQIIIDEPGKLKRVICSYILLRSLRCHTEKRRYIFAKDALITVSGEYNISPINCEDIGDGHNFILSLTEDNDKALFYIMIDEVKYIIHVPVQVFKHGFEGNLVSIRFDYLWIEDLKNDLYISMPGATEACAYMASKKSQITCPGRPLGNGGFRFDISEISQAIRTSDSPFNYISIKYKDNIYRNLSLYRVLNRTYVSKADVLFDSDNSIVVNVEYMGQNELMLRFTDENTGSIISEKTVKNGINRFPELNGQSLYTMHLLEVSQDPFGFLSTEREIGYPRKGVGAIDLENLSNCKIKLIGGQWSGIWLKLNYIYRLFNLYRIDEYHYLGMLTEQKKTDKDGKRYKPEVVSDKVHIECIPDQGKLYVISLQTEYEEGVFDPIYYDKKQQRFIRVDKATDNDYGRYIALYDDEVVFSTEVRRVR